jgi:flagellar FliL protein
MTGNAFVDKILVGISLGASLVCLGLFIYTEMVYQRPLLDNASEFMKLESDAKEINIIDSYKLEKLIVNLQSRTKRLRFLDVQVFIVPFKSGDISTLEEMKVIIHDEMIDVASRMEPDELNTVAGKILLESRVKKRINLLAKRPIAKRLYYTKFVVQ